MSRYGLLPTPPSRRCCGTTAATPGTSGTWPSNSTATGGRAGRARRATWSSAGSSPPRGRGTRGWPRVPRRSSSKPCGTSARRWPRSSTRRTRPGGRRGARPGGMRDSGSPGGAGGSGTCAALPENRPGPGTQGRVGPVPLVRAVPPDVKSYRVTMDRAGRWHVAFAVIPGPVPAPGNGQTVGIDRGVSVSAALSTGELLRCPRPDRAGAGQAAAAAAHAGPRQAGIEPPRPGQARDRPAAGPREGPAQGLGREGQHGHRAAVRRDPGREPEDREHDPVRERHPGEPGPERPAPRPG